MQHDLFAAERAAETPEQIEARLDAQLELLRATVLRLPRSSAEYVRLGNEESLMMEARNYAQALRFWGAARLKVQPSAGAARYLRGEVA